MILFSSVSRSLLVVAMLISLASAAAGQEWSQWRGPGRDGLVPASQAPKSWPTSLKQAWRVPTGEGYSSPLFSQGRVFVHARQDPDEVVTAIDYAKGEVLWQKKYPAQFQKNQYAVKMAKGPNATPLVVGNRLFTVGVTAVVNAWDTATGKLLWTKDFSKTVDTSKMFCGTAASPLLLNGQVVIQVGSDVHGGQILGLDPASGETRWEWRGVGPGYASPVVIDVGGQTHIAAMTNSSIVGVNPKDGAELWSIPFPDEWQENIVTPVWTGTHLIVAGTRQGTHAFALQQSGGKWQATEAWKNLDVSMYMSSPVYGDGLLYGFSDKRKGQFVALDAKTGVVRWITEGREGEHASVLLLPAYVVYLTNNADMIVTRRNTPKFEIAQRYDDVAEGATWAMPVFLGTDVLVRDASGVSRLTPGQ
jgi:outer membrane protein assembly factor BamB